MISRLLTLIVAITAGASAEPIRFLSGVYDSNGNTSWGTFSNLTVEYSAPANPIDTFHEIRGEGYVFCPVPLRIVDNDQDILFSGTFGIEGLILWVPNDAVTPYFHGIIEGTYHLVLRKRLGSERVARHMTLSDCSRLHQATTMPEVAGIPRRASGVCISKPGNMPRSPNQHYSSPPPR